MNIQNIIVALIVLLALLYVSSIVLKKIKSFSSKNSCATGCGSCGENQSSKIAKV